MNKSYKMIRCLLLLTVLSVIGCKQQVVKGKIETTFKNDTVLDSFFSVLHEKKMFNGAVAIKKQGKLIFKKGYGIANFEMGTPFTPNTAMEIASVSKQFTAAAVLKLYSEGKLDISQYVRQYLGDDFPYKEIKVYQLLNHSSGLADYEDYFKEHWDTSKIADNRDILQYFMKEQPPLISKPGSRYHYSNSGYVLLAEVVRSVSGQSLDEYLEKEVFAISGMVNSGFYDRDTIWELKNYAPGYFLDPIQCTYIKPELLKGKEYYHFLSGRLGSGRLSSSVEDLIKWDSILYKGAILNTETSKLAFTVHMPENDFSDYGFGWHVQEDEDLGKIVYHTGSWAGNHSYIKRFTDDESLIIILNNTHESANMKAIRTTIDAYVSGKGLSFPDQKAVDLLEKEICQLSPETVETWKNEHKDLDWDETDLTALKKRYIENKEPEKAKIVSKLISK
ncbi:serine hydrolase domain-containing protein [Robertkochia solimangrovi]|uniref:serine hydrolase domain-containing protein n=1 Tax=Robertkochia solimangrovi TaxID=2213046 RepID=UPI00117F319E|nr:serine hydrolase domain-containing protein [Robertkochia solimangrovi]TRZ41284.1 penicillin-binding protein [Robertkochia solimangrovi]